MDPKAGVDFLLMSHFKDVAKGSRSKHGNKCCVPLREPGLSICVRTTGKGGIQVPSVVGHPTPHSGVLVGVFRKHSEEETVVLGVRGASTDPNHLSQVLKEQHLLE